MEPLVRDSDPPRRTVPAAAPIRGAAAPRLQPLVDVASAGGPPLPADRRHDVVALSQPHRPVREPDHLAAAARRPGLHRRVRGDPRRLRPLHGQRRRPLVPSLPRQPAQRADRVLLCRVRVPRVARHLLGRPRRAGRRPHEERQRHGPAARRRGPPLPQGLLPPDDRRRRPPAARLPRLRPQIASRAARARPDRRPALRPGGVPGAHGPRRGLAGPGGPRPGPLPRHRQLPQRGGGPAHHPHPLRPRP